MRQTTKREYHMEHCAVVVSSEMSRTRVLGLLLVYIPSLEASDADRLSMKDDSLARRVFQCPLLAQMLHDASAGTYQRV
jgi:hypothetical protein